jgi:hypothetical protein
MSSGRDGRIFELQRPIIVLPVLLYRLHQYERIPRAISQFVLRQVGCNRISPRRKLLRAIEAMQVPIDPDENFLHQIFCLLAVADSAIYEVQEPGLIAFHQLRKSPLFPTKECRHDSGIIHRA